MSRPQTRHSSCICNALHSKGTVYAHASFATWKRLAVQSPARGCGSGSMARRDGPVCASRRAWTPQSVGKPAQAVDIPAGHGRRPIGPNGLVPASSAEQRMSTRSRANCDAKRPCGVRHAPKAPAPHWAGAETALGRDPLGDAAVVQREAQAHPRMNKHSPGLPISHSTFQSHESLLHVLRGLPGFSADSPHPASPPRAHPIPPSQIESLLLPEIAVRESSEGGRWKPSCIVSRCIANGKCCTVVSANGARRTPASLIIVIASHCIPSHLLSSHRPVKKSVPPESRPGSRPFSHPAKGPEISFLRPFSVSHPSNQYGTAADVTSAHAHATVVMGSS